MSLEELDVTHVKQHLLMLLEIMEVDYVVQYVFRAKMFNRINIRSFCRLVPFVRLCIQANLSNPHSLHMKNIYNVLIGKLPYILFNIIISAQFKTELTLKFMFSTMMVYTAKRSFLYNTFMPSNFQS